MNEEVHVTLQKRKKGIIRVRGIVLKEINTLPGEEYSLDKHN